VRLKFAGRRVRMVDQMNERIHHFAEIVRRDARRVRERAIYEQIWNARRKHARSRRFLAGIGRGMSVGEHCGAERCEARFGIVGNSRGIAFNGTEIPLSVDQRIPKHEVLGHAPLIHDEQDSAIDRSKPVARVGDGPQDFRVVVNYFFTLLASS